jgi:hypothetical protein
MLKHQSEIYKLMRGGKSKDVFANICYIFMRDLHLSYSEIKKMPIPLAMELLKRWQKEQAQNKKMSRRKR